MVYSHFLKLGFTLWPDWLFLESLANVSQVANGNESMDNNRVGTGRLSQGAASQNEHLLVDCRSLHSDVSSKGSNLIRNRR